MKVEAVRTPATVEEIGRALALAWFRLFGEMPAKASIALLLAQSAIETRRWQSCYSWGLGNAKWTPATDTDHCYRECNELLSPGAAKAAFEKAQPRADADGLNVALGGLIAEKQIVWFYPDHAASAFRAFATLEEGALDYLSLLATRFGSAWPSVKAGDPVGFVTRLAASHYFTAPLPGYLKPVESLFREYLRLEIDLSPPAPDTSGALAAAQDASLRDLSWSLLKGES